MKMNKQDRRGYWKTYHETSAYKEQNRFRMRSVRRYQKITENKV